MKAMFLVKIFFVCLGLLYGGSPVQAATIAVTTATDEFGTGTGCSLREALEAANSNSAFGGCNAGEAAPTVDTVSVGPGNYPLSVTQGLENQSGDLDTTESVILRGDPTNPANTVIDAAAVNDSVIETGSESGGTVTLSGLTLTGGKTTFGGGVHNVSDLLIVEFSIIRDNTATFGGGGIANHNSNANLILRNSLLLSNHATDSGGGTGFGGGLVVENSSAKVLNTTFSGNTAAQNGGGIRNTSGPLTLVNVTLTQNTADADKNATGTGGGIYAPFNTPLEVRNSIIAFNHTGAVADTQNCNFAEQTDPSSGYNVENANTCKFTATGDLANSGNLLLSSTASDNGGSTPTHALSTGSDAVDRVADGSCKDLDGATLTADQRGSARPINGDAVAGALCDSGAFELEVCGDAIVSGHEVCDPGSPVVDDCCSNDCRVQEAAGTPCQDSEDVPGYCNGEGACNICGDGQVGVHEDCDVGPDVASDCCAADCQFTPANSTCDDGKVETAGDLCDGAGACAGTPPAPPEPSVPPTATEPPAVPTEATPQGPQQEENSDNGGAGGGNAVGAGNQLTGSGCSLRAGANQGPSHLTVAATLLGLLLGARSFAKKNKGLPKDR